MVNRGTAYGIALAIYSTDDDDFADRSEKLYRTVDTLVGGSDEIRADLYAQLEETLTANTPFADAVEIIRCALTDSGAHYG
jgi:hypothetical protein